MNRIRSALRYVTTYTVLLHEFATARGWRFWTMLVAVLLNAFIHPLPFLLIAEILGNRQTGASDVALGWQRFSVHMPASTAVLTIFLVGSASYLFSYAVTWLVGRETVAWQSAMYWTLLGRAGRMARWDRSLELGVPLQPAAIASRIDIALRGAFPIGRLIETGSRDFVMILALTGIVLWQDARATAVLAGLSLLFVPAYAVALTTLVQAQSKSTAQLSRLLTPVTRLFGSQVSRKPGQGLDPSRISPAVTKTLSEGYGSQSLLLNHQNAVSVVAGVHVFAAFYGVYLAEGGDLNSLSGAKLSYLFFVVLLLRSMVGFIGLISRLSRGYERLGLLRMFLYPSTKPKLRNTPSAAGSFSLATAGSDGTPRILGPGSQIIFIAPAIDFEFQLLPLSNALQPQFVPEPACVLTVPLLGADDLPALLAAGVIAGDAATLRVPVVGRLALGSSPVDLARAPIVALTLAAWQSLNDDGMAEKKGKDRVTVIAVPGMVVPTGLPEGAVLALSDGRKLVAMGDHDTIAVAIEALAPKSAAPKTDDDELDDNLDG